MNIVIADIETRGYFRRVEEILCIGLGDYDTGKIDVYHGMEGLAEAVCLMLEAKTLVGHNILGFDVPVLEKYLEVSFARERIMDTLVMSRLYFPERTADRSNHSLKAWGVTFGMPKLPQPVLTKVTPELLEYNRRDVELSMKIFAEILTRGAA